MISIMNYIEEGVIDSIRNKINRARLTSSAFGQTAVEMAPAILPLLGSAVMGAGYLMPNDFEYKAPLTGIGLGMMGSGNIVRAALMTPNTVKSAKTKYQTIRDQKQQNAIPEQARMMYPPISQYPPIGYLNRNFQPRVPY